MVSLNPERTVELPRCVKGEEQPWVPMDSEIDPHKEATLMQKIQVCLQNFETSKFFSTFMDQIQTHDFMDSIYRVLGSEQKMQMVIYGIGSIDTYESSRMQLSLAILMKKHCSWIGEIEVFDPILYATETHVLEALNFSVILVNEAGRRKALKPTLFYMPHCPGQLYENLLQVNWEVDMLKNIVLLGNSFKFYKDCLSACKCPLIASRKNLLAAETFNRELRIDNPTNSDYYNLTFRMSSWQFFNPGSEESLEII